MVAQKCRTRPHEFLILGLVSAAVVVLTFVLASMAERVVIKVREVVFIKVRDLNPRSRFRRAVAPKNGVEKHDGAWRDLPCLSLVTVCCIACACIDGWRTLRLPCATALDWPLLCC